MDNVFCLVLLSSSSETQGQSVGSGEKAGRKFSSTDSYRTISKNSSGCRLLIGHKKCFVLLCPIGEQLFSLVRTQRLLSHHTCHVGSPSFCVQGKLLFSTFLTRNEGTTDESKKTFGILSAGVIEFAPRIFCF